MATLDITNSELKSNLALVCGVARDPVDWDAQIIADMNRIIRAGRRRFFMAHQWQFLEQDYEFAVTGPTTGTGTATAGVITLTAGTAPSNATAFQYKVVLETTGGIYDISSTNGSNTITLFDTGVTSAASETVKWYKYKYALPTNFEAFIDPIVVENWVAGSQLREYASIPDFQLTGLHNTNTLYTGAPEFFAISQEPVSEEGTFSTYLTMYPLIDDTYVLKTRIRILPGDALAIGTAVASPIISELMQEFILSAAETMFKGVPGIHTAMVAELLPLAIKKDMEMKGTRKLLPRDTANYSFIDPARRAGIVFQEGSIGNVTPITLS